MNVITILTVIFIPLTEDQKQIDFSVIMDIEYVDV
jgi:hypothetical protein